MNDKGRTCHKFFNYKNYSIFFLNNMKNMNLYSPFYIIKNKKSSKEKRKTKKKFVFRK